MTNTVQLRILLGTAIALFIVLIAMFAVQVEVKPPNNTRLILDRSLQAYISPPCFNQADITNNLTESTLQTARKLGFKPDSPCTERSLSGVKKSAIVALFEYFGWKDGYWSW
ncbi:hypothetical protein [Paenibacillus hamazuiensis]|uniref:hypothetical protein n=1 Tax=Paenibacillus hamazuiensis TaxID=2936508 RepID=UPI00200DD4AB|nr:hypothetical protein [Paenibacillus hamazuiensis]